MRRGILSVVILFGALKETAQKEKKNNKTKRPEKISEKNRSNHKTDK